MIAATARAVRECGIAGVSVTEIVRRSGVSRRTLYEVFADREECLHAAFEEALARAKARVLPAYLKQEDWREAVRAGLAAFLAFLDEEQTLGSFLVIDSLAIGRRTLQMRTEAIGAAVEAIDRGRQAASSASAPPRLTAEAIVGAALAIIQARLLQREEGARTRSKANTAAKANTDAPRRATGATCAPKTLMSALLGELMGVIVLPYLGSAAAAAELTRPMPQTPQRTAGAGVEVFGNLDIRLTYRTALVLGAIAAHPGASNRQVAQHAGVADQGQISKLLARLARAGLVENNGGAASRGEAHAWQLTAKGHQLEHTIKDR